LHNDSFEAPVERGGRYFFRKRLAGQDLSLLCVRRGLNAAEEILIDPLPWSSDHSASVTFENVSRDGRFVFYGRRDGGQDEITPRVLDVEAKITLPDAFPKAQYFGLEPTPDNKGVYYSRVTPDGPRAFYHLMGSDGTNDKLIYGKHSREREDSYVAIVGGRHLSRLSGQLRFRIGKNGDLCSEREGERPGGGRGQ
ncbi:MAG: hypothetical protein DMG51_20440, partial [Acidobacteria bacterium]